MTLNLQKRLIIINFYNIIRVIQILTNISNKQRQELKIKYSFLYRRTLIDDLKSELTILGSFKYCLLALLYKPCEFDAKTLNNALFKMNTNFYKASFFGTSLNINKIRAQTIFEIIITRNNEELKLIQEIYQKKYNRNLNDDLTNIKFIDKSTINLLLDTLRKNYTFNTTSYDDLVARSDAKRLIRHELNTINFTKELIRIFGQFSFSHLKKVIEEYQLNSLNNKTLLKQIEDKHEFNFYFKECLKTFINCALNMADYFARRLNEYIHLGSSLKDESIIRICVTRSEIDLELIKQTYKDLYKITLIQSLNDKTKGYFNKCLKAIIGENVAKINVTRVQSATSSYFTKNNTSLSRQDTFKTYSSISNFSENESILSILECPIEAKPNKSLIIDTIEKNEAIKLKRSISEILITEIKEEKQQFNNNENNNNNLKSIKQPEQDDLMKVCIYNHNYNNEINYMLCLNDSSNSSIRLESDLINVYLLPHKVINLIVERPNEFKFKSGDYILINIPDYSMNQWFTVTITSSPDQQDLSFYLIPNGNHSIKGKYK